MHIVNWVSDLLLISLSDFLNSGFAVESLSDGFVGLDKLVELFGQLLVLDGDYPDVVVQGINLHLQVRIVVE